MNTMILQNRITCPQCGNDMEVGCYGVMDIYNNMIFCQDYCLEKWFDRQYPIDHSDDQFHPHRY